MEKTISENHWEFNSPKKSSYYPKMILLKKTN